MRRRESCRERALKRKHVFRRQKRDQSSSISSDEAVLSAEEGSIGGSQLTSASLSLSSASSRDSRLSSASGLKADSRVSDFIDLSFWKRKEICCGTIFVGPSGKLRITDIRFLWNLDVESQARRSWTRACCEVVLASTSPNLFPSFPTPYTPSRP